MAANNRYCVIMGGGIGSRFWPYSRTDFPKQFIDFFGTGRSFIQMSFDRVQDIIPVDHIFVVTNALYAPLVKKQLPMLPEENILLEPARRNTAPCIAWAAYHIAAINPDASIMVAPSDHIILRETEFRKSVIKGFEFVEQHDALLTMGVKPSRPETGYGYIQIGKEQVPGINEVKTFTEKPNLELAKVFLDTGEFFWNSGIFLWKASAIKNALAEHCQDVASIFDKGAGLFGTPGELGFIANEFQNCPNISIDYAVMEKASNVFVECVDIGWSDVGTWGSLYEISPKNKDGNVTQNNKACMFNSKNNIVSMKEDKLVVAVGLNDYIIADADDVLLICPKADEQRIKLIVNEVKSLYGDKYI